MATRKEQIDQFRQGHREMYPNGETYLKASREEFLAYALVRGRPYWVVERDRRPRTNKEGPNGYGIVRALNQWFPSPDPVPVPVLPDGSDGEPPTPRGYPWPELDYSSASLREQVDQWLHENVPIDDRMAWNDRQSLQKASQQIRKDLNRWTPERIRLRLLGWQTSVKVRTGSPEEFKCIFTITRDDGLGANLDHVIGINPDLCWAALLKQHDVE